MAQMTDIERMGAMCGAGNLEALCAWKAYSRPTDCLTMPQHAEYPDPQRNPEEPSGDTCHGDGQQHCQNAQGDIPLPVAFATAAAAAAAAAGPPTAPRRSSACDQVPRPPVIHASRSQQRAVSAMWLVQQGNMCVDEIIRS
jgi:hypothetical protein